MDPGMQQQPQYYYAPGAPSVPPGYYAAPAPCPQTGAGDSNNGYVLPMQQQQAPQQMMYYAPAPPPPGLAPATPYGHYAPMYYQPTEAAFAALSLSGQTLLPMQQHQLQPQQTPGASSTKSSGSQPRASSTPIPTEQEQPASLNVPSNCNPMMMQMPVMYTQMPQYYQMAPATGYDQQMVTVMYQDPTTGQYMQTLAPMQQQQQPQQMNMNRMISMDPDAVPEINIDDISHISNQSSPEFSSLDGTMNMGQRHPSTPVSSMRRRVSLPPLNQNGGHIPNLIPSNFKTRMCTQWLEKRDCSMGSACKFAHGNQELRLPERPFRAINNPKYKTKMCKNFEPGATGLCAYAERCEYIHPTDREYATYKSRFESMARSRGEFGRYKAMFDEVPGVQRRGRGAPTPSGDEDSSKSLRSADSSRASGGASPPPPRGGRERRGSARDSDSRGGYLGSAMPPSITRSAIRMGAGSDAREPHHRGGDRDREHAAAPMRRNMAGGSMYNLASGTYTDRDEYTRTRLSRVPSASNVASMGASSGGFGGGSINNHRNPSRYGGSGCAPAKFNRRASMCHLNTAADY